MAELSISATRPRDDSGRKAGQDRLDQPKLEFQWSALARAQERNVAALREKDTDWNRWLLGRPSRPFDPVVYFEFRIFKEFSGGITDQWYSHGSGLAHFYLDTFIPDDTVSNGGIFAWHDVRENPDTFQCVSTFGAKEVLYTFSTTFGNHWGDHTIIRGTHGTLYSPGGEGSPQWWYIPETSSRWQSNVVFDLQTGPPQKQPVTIPGHPEVQPLSQDDNLKAHTDNWLECIRSRKEPNGSIRHGFCAFRGGYNGYPQLS